MGEKVGARRCSSWNLIHVGNEKMATLPAKLDNETGG